MGLSKYVFGGEIIEVLTDSTSICFAPGVRVILRGPDALQFGVDATRSGIIHTPIASELQPIFTRLDRPVAAGTFFAELTSRTGIGEVAAHSLIADLVSYRIIVAAATINSPSLILLGTGQLYDTLASLLSASNLIVRSPLRAESLSRFIASADPRLPMAIIDELPRARELARLMRHRSGTLLPVSVVDTRVFIGPLGMGRSGPCLYCADLYHEQRDDNWQRITAHLKDWPENPNPVVVAAGAAAAATVLRRICLVPDPPGVSDTPPQRGEQIIVDPFGPMRQTRTVLGPHPRCPVCY